MSIQPRELSSTAEIIANRRAVRTYFKTLPAWQPPAPPPEPAPEPTEQPIETAATDEVPTPDDPDPDPAPTWRRISGHRIRNAVARHYGLTAAEMESQTRIQSCVRPRHLAMYLCLRYSGLSTPQIGMLFGGRDHSTVVTAVKRFPNKMAKDPQLASVTAAFVRQIEEWK